MICVLGGGDAEGWTGAILQREHCTAGFFADAVFSMKKCLKPQSMSPAAATKSS